MHHKNQRNMDDLIELKFTERQKSKQIKLDVGLIVDLSGSADQVRGGRHVRSAHVPVVEIQRTSRHVSQV